MPKKRDLGLIAGTLLPILNSPNFKDLKELRDKIMYWKIFAHDLQLKNPQFTPVHPIQLEHAWLYQIMYMVRNGATCGKYRTGSLMWAYTIMGLFRQVDSPHAKAHFEDLKAKYPGLDISYALKSTSDIEIYDHYVDFYNWLCIVVLGSLSEKDQLIFASTLWPESTIADIIRSFELQSKVFKTQAEKRMEMAAETEQMMQMENSMREMKVKTAEEIEEEKKKKEEDDLDKFCQLFRRVDVRDRASEEVEKREKLLQKAENEALRSINYAE